MTTDKAALWTDGRYFLQAESQLGPDWTLMKAGTPGVPEVSQLLTMMYFVTFAVDLCCIDFPEIVDG